jgi:hypothetical protein
MTSSAIAVARFTVDLLTRPPQTLFIETFDRACNSIARGEVSPNALDRGRLLS